MPRSGPPRRPLAVMIAGLVAFASGPADAQEAVVGLAAPLSGPSAILGDQLRTGAELAAGEDTELLVVDTGCSADGGAEAARILVEGKARLATGFLCTEALLSARPILGEAGIPIIDLGVRANRVTDDRDADEAKVWRLAPRSDAEADAIADTIAERWRDEPFGLVEDGSIANRGLVDEVRRRLADRGLEPMAMDNYRPAEERQFALARRLQRTGISRFFIAGDRPDIAIVLRDAAELGLDLQVLAGESLLDEAGTGPDLPDGVTALAPPFSYTVEEPGGTRRTIPFYAGVAHAGIEIARAAIGEASRSGRALTTVLDEDRFTTILGPVTFDEKGDAGAVAFRPIRWTGSAFEAEDGPRTPSAPAP